MEYKKKLLKKIKHLKKKKTSVFDRTLITLLGIGGLVVIGLIITQLLNFLPQKSIANFLPADKTLVFLEAKDLELPTKLQNVINPLWREKTQSQNRMAEVLGSTFGVDFINIQESWGKGHIAFALIQKDDLTSNPVLFIKTRSKRKALKYFKSLTLPEETIQSEGGNNPIYSYSQGQPFSFAFVGNFVAIAKEKTALGFVQDALMEEGNALSEGEKYQKSINNLPRNKWILGYVNFRKLTFKDNAAISNIIEPLKHTINHFAFTVRKNPGGFHFNTFLNLNQNLLSLQEDGKGGFAYELTDYVLSDNLAFYFGGANLEAEWQNTLSTISNLNPAYGVILEGVIRAQISDIFGSEIDLRNDIYPLFEGEYAVAIGIKEGKKEVSLILSHSDKDFVKKKLKKLSQGFRFLASKFAPKVHLVTLPDGSESRELIPDEDSILESKESHGGYEVNCIEVSNTDSGFCYSATDELIIMTNSKESIVDIIELNDESTVLSQEPSFRKTLGNLSKVSDEITYINIEKATELLSGNAYIMALKPLLDNFDATSYVKHYFADGVSSEGYILIK